MFSDVHLHNFGAFSDFRWSGHGRVNVVVGENDTGKSHLLKVMYTFAKSVEDLAIKQARDPEGRSRSSVFGNKLRWTFQPASGNSTLIHDGEQSLHIEVTLVGKRYAYTLNRLPTKRLLGILSRGFAPQPGVEISTVFLPPKEVLTIFAAIEISRSKYEIYGFDDTYYDLLQLLRVPLTQGRVVPELHMIADELDGFIGGQIVRKGIEDEFLFKRGTRAYTMPQTADGIKKIGILANLIRNRSIKPGTILFLDEPETNLHPRAISSLMSALFRLGQAGVQVYLATHSYFVLKELEILAKQHKTSVPFCSLVRRGAEIEAKLDDMRDGMPENPIIDASLRLYQQGIDVDMRR